MPDTNTAAPLTTTELDRLTCAAPGCTHENHGPLFLHSRCHLKSPTIIRYWGDGVVEIRCKICNHFVGSIALQAEQAEQLTAKIECTDPNCKEPAENHTLLMKPPCHPTAGQFAVYHGGHLTLACAKCQSVQAVLHVKEVSAEA